MSNYDDTNKSQGGPPESADASSSFPYNNASQNPNMFSRPESPPNNSVSQENTMFAPNNEQTIMPQYTQQSATPNYSYTNVDSQNNANNFNSTNPYAYNSNPTNPYANNYDPTNPYVNNYNPTNPYANNSNPTNPYVNNNAQANLNANNSTPYNSFEFQNQVPPIATAPIRKKKSHKVLIGVLLGIMILAGAGVVAVKTIPALSNTFSLLTMSAGDYYTKIEQGYADKGIHTLSKSYGNLVSQSADKSTIARNVDMKITLGEVLSSQLTFMDFQSFETKISTMMNSEKGNVSVELLANDTSLATVNTFIDIAANQIYAQIPELTKSYLNVDISSLSSNPFSETNLNASSSAAQMKNLLTNPVLSQEQMDRILTKYSNLISKELGDIKNVTLSKNQTITANGLDEKANKVTIEITPKDLKNIIISVLKEAKDDEDIKKFCDDSDIIPAASYSTLVEAALISITDEEISEPDANIATMIIWTDGDGEVIGRELTINSPESITLGYTTAQKDDSSAFEIWCSQEDDRIISFLGKLETKDAKQSGLLELNVAASVTSADPISIKLDIADFEVTDKTKGYFNGNFKVTSDAFSGYNLALTAKATKTSQNLSFKVSDKSNEMATVSFDISEGTFKDFDLPGKSDKTYDAQTEIGAYTEEVDWESFARKVSTALKLDQDYADEFISNFGPQHDQTVSPDYTTDPEVSISPDPTNVLPGDATSYTATPKEVDADGYYTYTPDYETIKAAGIGSSTFVPYDISGTITYAGVSSLILSHYADVLTFTSETTSNMISGHEGATPEDTYEYTYFTTTSTWQNLSDSNQYLSFTKDSVTDAALGFNFTLADKTRAVELILSLLTYLEGEPSEEDSLTLLATVTFSESESSSDYTYKNTQITLATLANGTYSCSLSHVMN